MTFDIMNYIASKKFFANPKVSYISPVHNPRSLGNFVSLDVIK